MNLLPKSHKEFGEKDYWNKFFKKRGTKAFEWYGEYLELCSQLHKYIKQKDFILVTGCGNSSLSADLYDVGFTNITNIDLSEVVIKQMNRINSHRSDMKFIYMDATKMSFENDSFNVILDKGTLDALMPDESKETILRIDKYFDEIKRVLKLGGRYICISLLQEHILRKLLHSFCDGSWMFRVVRCHDAEEKNTESDGRTFPVFVVVATKFKLLPQLILEVCMAGDKMERLNLPQEIQSCVKTVQDAAVVTNGLATTSLADGEEVSLDLFESGTDNPRYSLYVIDKVPTRTYSVFIVPQGRESEWMFGTPAGRAQLHKSAGCDRLAVVLLRRGQVYVSLDSVKEELSHCAKMIAPKGFTGQISFLSIGSDVGRRVKVYEGTSKCSGDFVVEDVDAAGDTFRRLIFLDNQFLVQSEAKMKTVQSKGKTKSVVDFGHITFYHSYMCVGVMLSQKREQLSRVAVLGLGGGSLCMFLRKCFKRLSIVAVDIDEAMLQIATDQFQLQTDGQLSVQIKDGLDFLKDEAAKGNQYDAIIFDMDSKDRSVGLSCPPRQFMQEDVLKDVKAVLTNNGQFVLNLVCRDAELHDSIIRTVQDHFRHVIVTQLYEDVNEVVFATNRNAEYTLEEIGDNSKELNTMARDAKLVKAKCVDLKDILQSVSIVS